MFSIFSHYFLQISANILQVQRQSNFLQKWFSKITKLLKKKKHVLLTAWRSWFSSYTSWHLQLHTHLFINPFASWMSSSISPSKQIGHPCVEAHLPLNYPSWLRTRLSFWVTYISLVFSVQFSLSVKLSSSLSMTSFPFHTHCYYWDILIYSPTILFITNHVDWCGIP